MPIRFAKPIVAAALASVVWVAPASAATISEGSFAGGDFSGAYGAPTAIASGYDTITGSLGSGDYDFLAFTGMTPGAQTVTFDFSATGVGNFLSAGPVLFSITPFTSATSGGLVGNIALFDAGFFSVTTQTLTLNLGAGFVGTLYLALNLAGGPAVNYSLSVPGNVPATVPLPATALLLGGAVAGMGALRRRARAR